MLLSPSTKNQCLFFLLSTVHNNTQGKTIKKCHIIILTANDEYQRYCSKHERTFATG